jgi:hypothetical protein
MIRKFFHTLFALTTALLLIGPASPASANRPVIFQQPYVMSFIDNWTCHAPLTIQAEGYLTIIVGSGADEKLIRELDGFQNTTATITGNGARISVNIARVEDISYNWLSPSGGEVMVYAIGPYSLVSPITGSIFGEAGLVQYRYQFTVNPDKSQTWKWQETTVYPGLAKHNLAEICETFNRVPK